MKNILYISDLDGTLLNSKKQIPKAVQAQLNQLINEKGVSFSVATARTPATVEILLNQISMQEKVVLMNGAVLYDLGTHQYIDIANISEASIRHILNECQRELEEGFIYTIHNNELIVYYHDLSVEERHTFFEERQNLQYKKFVKGKPQVIEEIVYFVFIDHEDKIKAIDKKLEGVQDIAKVCYKDIYSETGWILEVYSKEATKANGIKKLKSLGQYDEVVAFGDNYNDLPMFEVSDRCYAVSNAMEAVKEQATGVIGTCEEGSVVQFIADELNK